MLLFSRLLLRKSSIASASRDLPGRSIMNAGLSAYEREVGDLACAAWFESRAQIPMELEELEGCDDGDGDGASR